MARSRFAGRSAARRGPRRLTAWTGLDSGTDKVAVAAASAVLLAAGAGAFLTQRPFTVTRSRGTILVANDQFAVPEEPQLILAIGVFSDTAVAAGVASLPDPVTNPDGDWFVFEDVPTGILVDVDGNTLWRAYPFDSKAMRKVGLDENIAMIVANNSAADGAQILVTGRILLKLH